MTNLSITRFALSAIMVSALAACGGGGGSAEVSAPTNATPGDNTSVPNTGAPDSTGGTIARDVPANNYVAGSAERAAFDLLNAERLRCGFGATAQAAALDRAARAHSDYLLNFAIADLAGSFQQNGHLEDAARPGYTGVTPADRVRFQQYAGSNEDNRESLNRRMASQGPGITLDSVADLAAVQMRSMLTSVYHVRTLLAPSRAVGIGHSRGFLPSGADFSVLNLEFGLPTGTSDQTPESGTVRSFPCAGTTTAAAAFRPALESPNPAPDLGAGVIGTPIYIAAPKGSTLTVNTVTVTDSTGSASVRVMDAATDPAGVLAAHEVFILPLRALAVDTPAEVTAMVTMNGAPTTVTFTFRPAAERL